MRRVIGLTLITFLVLRGPAAPASFITAPNYPAGTNPVAAAVGDFNGDGIPDLAVCDYPGTVSILLGNGDGTFQTPRVINTNAGPTYSIAVGDFNGDGLLDLAVGGADLVSVLLGNGDGSFQAYGGYSTNPALNSVAMVVADFNGDGIPDLAVISAMNSMVTVFLGKGDGRFESIDSAGLAPSALALAAGDFDGDGKVDLAASGQAGLFILHGHGDGTFEVSQVYSTRGGSIASADLNGDGKLDLVTSGGNVFLGNGDGTFQACQDLNIGSAGRPWVAIADFNGDGVPDLAVTHAGFVSIFGGNGDGTFQAAANYVGGPNPWFVVVADFNGDGALDLAVVNSALPNLSDNGSVSILLGTGKGTFRAARSYATDAYPRFLTVADVNSDGMADLVLSCGIYNGPGTVDVVLGSGGGMLSAAQSYPVGFNPGSVKVADFNHDGIPDLAVVSKETATNSQGIASILLGNGNGTFQNAQNYAVGPDPGLTMVGDFNGDGTLDLLVVNGIKSPGYDGPASPGTVTILLGNGDGTFQPGQSYAVGTNPAAVVLADFNGDGVPDLAVVNYGAQGTLSILLGNGDGSFQAPQSYTGGFNPTSMVVVDFNGDGVPDLAVLAGFYAVEATVQMFLGVGDGTFRAAGSFVSRNAIDPTYLGLADFNGDGKLDLVAVGIFGGTMSILLGNGDGTFQAAHDYSIGPGTSSVLVSDFNGDGVPDVVAVNAFLDTVSIFLGNGDGTLRGMQNYKAGAALTSLAIGDFNGDGFPDLAVANAPGTVTILLNGADWGP